EPEPYAGPAAGPGTRPDARTRRQRGLCRRGVGVLEQAPAGLQGGMMNSIPEQASGTLAIPEDPQELAELAARTMYDNDPASQALGARLVFVAPGEARMSMTVRGDMLNGHKTCHGGFIFALADSTFAFACNSRNLAT